MSRTIGDFNFKPVSSLPPELQSITPAPDINVVSRDMSADQFLLLASDGIFKSLTSVQVCDVWVGVWGMIYNCTYILNVDMEIKVDTWFSKCEKCMCVCGWNLY